VVVATSNGVGWFSPLTGLLQVKVKTAPLHAGRAGLSPVLFADGSVLVATEYTSQLLLIANGTVVWDVPIGCAAGDIGSPLGSDDDFVRAVVGLSVNPLTGDILVLSGCGTLAAIDWANGSVLWSTADGSSSQEGTGMLTVGVVGSRALLFARGSNGTSALDASTGAVVWSVPCAGIDPGAFWNGTLFVPTLNALVALDALTGIVLWNASVPASLVSVSDDGIVYAIAGTGHHTLQNLVAVNASNGAEVWFHGGSPSGFLANAIVLPSGVCAADEEHSFWCYDRRTGQGTVNTTQWVGMTPAVADSGFIFFRSNEDSLLRFDPSTLTP
jgi:outer membrane protein assembly factor BamB